MVARQGWCCHGNHIRSPFILLVLRALEGRPTHMLMGGGWGEGYVKWMSRIISVREGKGGCEPLSSDVARWRGTAVL